MHWFSSSRGAEGECGTVQAGISDSREGGGGGGGDIVRGEVCSTERGGIKVMVVSGEHSSPYNPLSFIHGMGVTGTSTGPIPS